MTAPDNATAKRALRREMRSRKAEVSTADKQAEADATFAIIEASEAFATARSVLLYHSLPDELPTHQVIGRWAGHKDVLLPRVVGDDLEIARYDGNMSSDNTFHIAEPTGDALDIVPDIIIVPAVALDRHGHRLGRGKGYYDRLLARCPDAYTVGVVMRCQLLDEVPTEPHDRPLDAVATADGMIVNHSR